MAFDAFSAVYWISPDSALHSLEFVCRMGFVFSRLSISPFKGLFMVNMFLMVINDDLMSSFAWINLFHRLKDRELHTHESKIECTNHVASHKDNYVEKQFHFQFCELFCWFYASVIKTMCFYIKLVMDLSFWGCHLDSWLLRTNLSEGWRTILSFWLNCKIAWRNWVSDWYHGVNASSSEISLKYELVYTNYNLIISSDLILSLTGG